LHTLAPDSAAYHVAGAVRFRSRVDAARLARALGELHARHLALHGVIHVGDAGEPVVRAGDTGFELERGAAGAIADDAHRPFDLARGPVWRAVLYPDDTLLLSFHHIAVD